MFLIVPFFMFGTLLNVVLSDPGTIIPSKQEQTNLLKNVEEVFKEIKELVTDEGEATDSAVIFDVQKIVDRALEHLALYEDLAMTKISCGDTSSNEKQNNNALPKRELKIKIEHTIQEGEDGLQMCTHKAADEIYRNSNLVTTTTKTALNQGQTLLDTLNRCSNKVGLNQISCYKKVISSDVHPLKESLIDAIRKHRVGHMEAISIRNRANECVDAVLENCRNKIIDIISSLN